MFLAGVFTRGSGGGRRGGGSSPHIRGTPGNTRILSLPMRLIPAHTGNTATTTSTTSAETAHPRTYGEHDMWDLYYHCLNGSSPHIRGTLNSKSIQGFKVRLIPAHTGNTRTRSVLLSVCSAHPRTYGEHRGLTCKRRSAPGSSPHIRGTLSRWILRCSISRLIPAHTGNTLSHKARYPTKDQKKYSVSTRI